MPLVPVLTSTWEAEEGGASSSSSFFFFFKPLRQYLIKCLPQREGCLQSTFCCLPKSRALPLPVQLAVNAVVQKAKSHESPEMSLAQMLGLLFCQPLPRAKAPPLISGCQESLSACSPQDRFSS